MSVWYYHKVIIKNQDNELLEKNLFRRIGENIYFNYDYLNGKKLPIKRYWYNLLHSIDSYEIKDNELIIYSSGNHLVDIGKKYFIKKFNYNVEIESSNEYDQIDDDIIEYNCKETIIKEVKDIIDNKGNLYDYFNNQWFAFDYKSMCYYNEYNDYDTLIIEVLKFMPWLYELLSNEKKNDINIIKKVLIDEEVIREHTDFRTCLLNYVSDEILKNKSLMLENDNINKVENKTIKRIVNIHKKDTDFLKELAKKDYRVIEYVYKYINFDVEFYKELIDINVDNYYFFPNKIKTIFELEKYYVLKKIEEEKKYKGLDAVDANKVANTIKKDNNIRDMFFHLHTLDFQNIIYKLLPNELKENDKDIILESASYYRINNKINKELFKDKEFCKKLLSVNGLYLKYMPSTIKDNKNLVKIALKNGGSILDASKRIQKDRKLIIYSIDSCNRSDLYLLQNLPTSIYNDYDIILNHILSTPDFNDFRYNASCKLETNGVKKLFYEKISDRIKKDRKKTLEIIKKDEYFYYFIDNSLKQDKDFVIELIKINPNILKLVDDSLKDDKEFMLDVVKMNSYALKYASDRLRDDEEVIEAAITEDDCEGLKYVNKRFGYRKSFVMDVVRKSKCALKFVSDGFKDDKDVALEAIKHDSKNILYLNNLFDDKDFLNSIIEYFYPFRDSDGKIITVEDVLKQKISKELSRKIKECLSILSNNVYSRVLSNDEKIKLCIIAANRWIVNTNDNIEYEDVQLDYFDYDEVSLEEDDLPF